MNFIKKISYFFSLFLWCAFTHANTGLEKDSIYTEVLNAYKLIAKSNFKEANSKLNALLTYTTAIKDTSNMANVLNMMGILNFSTGNLDSSTKNLEQSISYFSKIGNIERKSVVESNLARNYFFKKQYHISDSINSRAIKQLNAVQSDRVFYVYRGLIETSFFQKKYHKVLSLSKEAIAVYEAFDFSKSDPFIADNIKNRTTRVIKLFEAFSMLELNKNIKKALTLLEENAFKANEHESWDFYITKDLIDNYKIFYYFYTSNKDSLNYYIKKAITNTQNISSVLDSIMLQVRKHNIEINDKQRALQKGALQQQQQQSELKIAKITIASIAIILILVMLIFGHRRKSYKKQKEFNLKLKEQNEKLKKIDKQRLQFFSIISHELRTPVHGIYGISKLLKESNNIDDINSYIHMLEHSSTLLKSIVNNVLQYSRFDLESLKIKESETNIKELLDNIVVSFNFAAKAKNNQLKLFVDPLIDSVIIDPSMLSQIIINLIGNAIKFTQNGTILITVNVIDRSNDYISLAFNIKDDGKGIPKYYQEKIFKPFESIKDETEKGTGLGLYIVKKLLENLNSTISLTSKIDVGSTFSFNLTLKTTKKQLEERPKIVPKEERILIVDDNKINVLVTKRILEGYHYKCDVALSGFEAISKTNTKAYDLILMDINMPEMDGYETTKRIKTKYPEIIIIALTAINKNEVHQRSMDAGMDDVQIKPFKPEELILKINQLRNSQYLIA